MTTHSPHIVSVSPIASLVLLKQAANGSTEGVSTACLDLEDRDREDLERYLDVSRGEMLFAKGVLLVEGDAEVFVVPTLAKCAGYDLDELGITVCSVSGTNFAPYVKLLGTSALDVPFAVVTDFDPQQSGKNLGENRVLRLLEQLVSQKELVGKGTKERLGLAATHGIFLNDYTFEVDLFKCGRHKSIGATLIELAASGPAEERAKGWRDDPATLDEKAFLSDIEAIGKGRFGQRLAGKLKKDICPKYIRSAIEYVATRC
jgi:putative ATP-dependent endonuclease of OLD family